MSDKIWADVLDQFATAAMRSLVSNVYSADEADKIAEQAYIIADAMMAHREMRLERDSCMTWPHTKYSARGY